MDNKETKELILQMILNAAMEQKRIEEQRSAPEKLIRGTYKITKKILGKIWYPFD